jgi:hypothetical protein
MMKSIVFSALLGLVLGLAACAQNQAPPPIAAASAPTSLVNGFVPYCGPIWSVERQGYLYIPCPPGSGYEGQLLR